MGTIRQTLNRFDRSTNSSVKRPRSFKSWPTWQSCCSIWNSIHHVTRPKTFISWICAKRFLKFDKEEVGFLILSFGSLNTSAMVAAICNMTCTLIAQPKLPALRMLNHSRWPDCSCTYVSRLLFSFFWWSFTVRWHLEQTWPWLCYAWPKYALFSRVRRSFRIDNIQLIRIIILVTIRNYNIYGLTIF